MNTQELVGRIAIYARISKEDSRKRTSADSFDGSSTESQVFRCKQYLGSQCSQQVVGAARVYTDEGYSGSNIERPGFQQLMADVRAGLIDRVIFTELSRVSRSVRDFLDLSEEFRRLNVEWVSVRERFDTGSVHGRLLVTIFMALNQFEREQTALRTKLNMRACSQRGLFNGGSYPVGYRPNPTQKGHLVIEAEEAAFVRKIYDLYLEAGSSLAPMPVT